MPIGVKFERKHKKLGYLAKYLYYCVAKRNILQKRMSFGQMNSDRVIYVIKPDYQDGVEGLLSLINKQILYMAYAKKKGYCPYIDWKNYKTQYYDGKNNAWEYFFKQPSNLTENEVYKSKKVYLSGWSFKTVNPEGLFEADVFTDKRIREKSSEMLCEHIRFSDEVLSIVNKEATSLNISECIGVYIRGTDYVKLKPCGEYVQPSVDQMKCKIHEFENKYNAPIFLVTEDGDIFDNLKKEFGDIIRIVSFDTFIRNYEGKDVLSKSDVLEKDKKLRGQKYLAKMILLAKCKYFVGSMTQGSKFSYILNNGNYSDEYIFDLGLYP
jgi:hypothetical protein